MKQIKARQSPSVTPRKLEDAENLAGHELRRPRLIAKNLEAELHALALAARRAAHKKHTPYILGVTMILPVPTH